VTYAHRAGSPVLEAYMAGQMGYFAAAIGLTDDAQRFLGHASSLASPPAQARLAVLEASAHARVRNAPDCFRCLGRAEEAIGLDEACRLTGEAFEVAVGMTYTRLLGRVQEVRRAFPASWKGSQVVRELDEKMVEGMLG